MYSRYKCLDISIEGILGMNSPILHFGAPPAIRGQSHTMTASWKNVDKHMPRNTKITHELV